MLDRRTFLIVTSAAGASMARDLRLHAQAWTDKPVIFINPFSAGSAVEVVARLIADDMTRRLGTPFQVENRTGASGVIGTEAVLQAGADGQTGTSIFYSSRDPLASRVAWSRRKSVGCGFAAS